MYVNIMLMWKAELLIVTLIMNLIQLLTVLETY